MANGRKTANQGEEFNSLTASQLHQPTDLSAANLSADAIPASETLVQASFSETPVTQEHRASKFIQEQFGKLSFIERSLALVTLLSQQEVPEGDRYSEVRELHQGISPLPGEDRQVVIDALKRRHNDYYPAWGKLALAAMKGHEIVLLTARGGKDKHETLLQEMERFSGFKFDRGNVFFAADEFSHETDPFRRTSVWKRKLTILDQLAEAQSPERIVFYDDHRGTVDLINAARRNGLEAVYSLALSFKEIFNDFSDWLNGGHQETAQAEVHVFDVDETLVNLPGNVYIKGPDGKVLMSADHETIKRLGGINKVIELAFENHAQNGISRSDIYPDFTESESRRFVASAVEAMLRGEALFKMVS